MDQGIRVIRGHPPEAGPALPVLTQERWAELKEVDVIVVSHLDACTAGMIAVAPRLQGIVSTVIGVDTIDMEAADRRDIVVAHGAMEENYLGVSEATVMLVAALFLELHVKEALLRENAPPPTGMIGRMVRGKTLGLVGLGRTARGVVDRLEGWEVRILGHDPFVSEPPSGVELKSLEALLRAADVVSLHAPLTPETRRLIGRRELSLMKREAYLINTARGALIDDCWGESGCLRG
jgi:phosphoglycerate dehydrogenase-like enzyme